MMKAVLQLYSTFSQLFLVICLWQMERFQNAQEVLHSRKLSADLPKRWKTLYEESIDPVRTNIAKEAISHAAGIYYDTAKAKRFKTENTVLVNVLAFNKDNQHIRYQHLLQNWFCFANHHGLRPLTYLVPVEGKNFSTQVNELHSIGVHGEFITYPNELFWSFVSNKTTPIGRGFGKVDYDGVVPSFNHFGALVMLVPILEVLEHGFDAIYIDLDVGFVHDPIPHMIRNNVEFSISNEMKTCYCPSVKAVALVTGWNYQEPNTGIMRIRSTKESIRIVYDWLKRNVDENVSNDQKVLDLIGFGARISFECNPQLMPISDVLIEHYNNTLKPYLRVTKEELATMPRYCFLNEYLFQNGKLALHCAQNKHGSGAEYLKAMDQMNFTVWNDTSQRYEKTLAPAIIHMNYCDDKIAELSHLGMWLPMETNTYTSNVCRRYRYEDTVYGKANWNAKLAAAYEELGKLERMLVNGSTFKLHRWPHMYMYYDGKFRIFPNGETFEAMGLDWKKLNYPGPYNMFKAIPPGDPLPDLKVYPKRK